MITITVFHLIWLLKHLNGNLILIFHYIFGDQIETAFNGINFNVPTRLHQLENFSNAFEIPFKLRS